MVAKSGVEIVVDTADIIDKDKDIYIILFNKYKKQIENGFGLIESVRACQKEDNFQKLERESQDKLRNELMKIF